jgi:peptidoglycan-N-acetylmuramic acid deacetylase
LFALPATPIAADTAAHNWYCVHVKDHIQPRVGADIGFAEEYGGFYIDHEHSDMSDSDKVIYLTFDAGYENGNVAKLLDVLKEKDASAAFFVLGNLIAHDTALVRRMADEGHLICNHTLTHPDMTKLTDRGRFAAQLNGLRDCLKQEIGIDIAKYYRPTEGKFSRQNLKYA